MIFGTRDRFALELESWMDRFASIAVWVNASRFGDTQQVSVKGALLADIENFLQHSSSQPTSPAATSSASEVSTWLRILLGSDPDTLDAAQTQDRLVRAVWLFAYAPEGLAGICTTVGFAGDSVRITAWDDAVPDDATQVVVPRTEFDAVIASAFHWLRS